MLLSFNVTFVWGGSFTGEILLCKMQFSYHQPCRAGGGGGGRNDAYRKDPQQSISTGLSPPGKLLLFQMWEAAFWTLLSVNYLIKVSIHVHERARKCDWSVWTSRPLPLSNLLAAPVAKPTTLSSSRCIWPFVFDPCIWQFLWLTSIVIWVSLFLLSRNWFRPKTALKMVA